MADSGKNRGPSREQFSDEQWQAYCRVNDFLYARKQRRERERLSRDLPPGVTT